jgi:hypothetical protein
MIIGSIKLNNSIIVFYQIYQLLAKTIQNIVNNYSLYPGYNLITIAR